MRQVSQRMNHPISENCDFRDRVVAGGGGEEGPLSRCQEGFQVEIFAPGEEGFREEKLQTPS